MIYSLIMLGEAVNKLSIAIRERNPDIGWRKIVSTRHRIVQECFGIDYDIVWQIVTTQIPNLHLKLNRALKAEE